MRTFKVPDRRSGFRAATAIALLAMATSAEASGTGMPREQPVQQVLDSVQGLSALV
jgi:type IV secretion system protein VirB2